jgi:hypothetical protein
LQRPCSVTIETLHMPSKGGTAAAKTDVAIAAASNPVENRSANMNANRD